MVALVDAVRATLIGLLAVTIAIDMVSVELVLVTLFILGTAETYADVTAGTLLPMIVDRDDLGVANARMSFGLQSLNQLAGPPLGALLFGVGMTVLGRFGFRGLPGDVRYESGATRIYFPIVSCIVLSVLLTVGMWVWNYFTRR